MSSYPTPGLVWACACSRGVLRVIRVLSRTPSVADHFVLTLQHVPIGPSTFTTSANAIRYAEQEWTKARSAVDAG